MNKIISPKPEIWLEILKRPTQTVDDIEVTVKEIFKEVQRKGDEAVAKYTSIFDGISLDNYEVSQAEIEEAISLIPIELKEAIELAKNNIYNFHNAQKTDRVSVETIEGVNCWQEKKTNSENWFIYSRRNSTIVFNCFNACCSG